MKHKLFTTLLIMTSTLSIVSCSSNNEEEIKKHNINLTMDNYYKYIKITAFYELHRSQSPSHVASINIEGLLNYAFYEDCEINITMIQYQIVHDLTFKLSVNGSSSAYFEDTVFLKTTNCNVTDVVSNSNKEAEHTWTVNSVKGNVSYIF